MSKIPNELLYTKDHEWVRKASTPKHVVVGITDFAQSSLGDVTYIQLPPVGSHFKTGAIIGTVESVKAVSDIYAPVSGKILKINDALASDPAPVNHDPYGSAWLVEVELDSEDELKKLLNAAAYEQVAQ
jgi:glycine cleavage system H protein